jgi:hypothetical protein
LKIFSRRGTRRVSTGHQANEKKQHGDTEKCGQGDAKRSH